MPTLRIILAVLFAVGVLPGYGQSAGGGDDTPRPVKGATSGSPAAAVQFSSFEFQRPYLGREGPNFTRLDTEPSAGAKYLVRARLFRPEAVATAKFELVDDDGRHIQPLYLSKYDNSLDDGNFVGSVTVPRQPFRVVVSGRGVDGKPYRRAHERLIRPTTRPPRRPLVPPGLPPADAKNIAASLIALEKQAIAEMEKRVRNHPDGVIVMPRVEVTNVTYEPFLSGKGNRLGMRLRYDLRFSVDGDYAHSLQVLPSYEDDNIHGLVEMQVLNEEIDPRPGPPSYATPQIHVDLNTLVRYGSEAWFKGGVVYRFTVVLVPDYVGQNASKTKFCVDEEHYEHKVRPQRAWEAMKADAAPVKYRVFINKVDYGGETEPFHPPGSFYEGFLREGAVKCKPYKNTNF